MFNSRVGDTEKGEKNKHENKKRNTKETKMGKNDKQKGYQKQK